MKTETTKDKQEALIEVIFDALQIHPYYGIDALIQADGISAFHELIKGTKYEAI